MLREIHGLSTEETADRLQLTRNAVKTRLHRARDWIKRRLAGSTSGEDIRFDGARCNRLATAVMTRLQKTIETSGRESRATHTETAPSMLVWK
jgi:RNA polymerase sigma-70 factor (ECF subfamily)